MQHPANAPSKRAVLRAYRAFFCVGGALMAWGLASRLKIVDCGWGTARPAVEHGIGGAGIMIVLFGIFCAHDYIPGKTNAGIQYCRKVARATAAILAGVNFSWELGQGYSSYVASIYHMAPRGYIQWEQVLADWLGVLIGFGVVHGFIHSKANPLRSATPPIQAAD